jgi:hypothetical protein
LFLFSSNAGAGAHRHCYTRGFATAAVTFASHSYGFATLLRHDRQRETDRRLSRPGAAGRSDAAMAAWYAAALLALGAWLGPELAKPTVEPVRSCTPKLLECVQWTPRDTVVYLVLPNLLSCLIMSFITLAVTVR